MEETKLKVIIADDEVLICNVLRRIIRFEELNLELAGIANDGETLLRMIEQQKPDIVLTDIYMPKLDGLEVIKRVRQTGQRCAFLIISGYRQFEYAYEALKYDVVDFILKPIDEQEINKAMKKAADDFRQLTMTNSAGNVDALRRYFITTVLDDSLPENLEIEKVNHDYLTHFAPGLFRALVIKLDYDHDFNLMSQNIGTLYDKVEELVMRRIGAYGLDILFERKFDGLHVLLNYPVKYERQITSDLSDLYSEAKDMTSLFGGMRIAIGASGQKLLLSEAPCARAEARTAAWSRRFLGYDGVIYYKKQQEKHSSEELDALRQRLLQASETLNAESFAACVDSFFNLPTEVLSSEQARLLCTGLITDFFSMHERVISTFAEPQELKRELLFTIHRVTTATKYRDALKSQFGKLFDQITDSAEKQAKRPIRLAVQYVEQNFDKRIDLNQVAELVNLSPVYFSHIFKKETGENFTDYINSYRVKMAKRLLKNSDLSVKEISAKVGFQDPQYFSKIFRRIAGIKPMEYRKFYG